MGVEGKKPALRPPTLDVWIIAMGDKGSVRKEDFKMCSDAVDKALVPQNSYLKGDNAWRYIVGSLLPQFTMRHRHIPRAAWEFKRTKSVEGPGKPYISMKYDPDDPANKRPALGFGWAETGYAMAYVTSMGPREVVINIGIGLRSSDPGVSAAAFLASEYHMLSEAEASSLNQINDPATLMRRLTVILCMKDAYLQALGQPVGFDQSRISISVSPNSSSAKINVDGAPLSGWEFRIFTVFVPGGSGGGSGSSSKMVEPHQYQAAVAVFRGMEKGVRVVFESREEAERFVRFLPVAQIVGDVKRLGDYDHLPVPNASGEREGEGETRERRERRIEEDRREREVVHGAMPPVDRIPLSTRSSVQTLVTGKASPSRNGSLPSSLSRPGTHPQPHSPNRPPSYKEKEREPSYGRTVPIHSHSQSYSYEQDRHYVPAQ